jgi:hypothetical protein
MRRGRDGSVDEVAWFGFRTESEQCSGQQEQNAPRLFAQLDDGAIAAQFSTRGIQFEDAEAPGPWRVTRHAHWHAPLGWRNCSAVGSS